jgi:hypothetical protein
LTDLSLRWMSSELAPAVTAMAASATTKGAAVADDFLSSLIQGLDKVISSTASGGSWAQQQPVLSAAMQRALGTFVGSETEKLDRLGLTYTQTMLTRFNSSMFGEAFAPESDMPFVQFWTEYDSTVCEDCKPLDGAIFDKKDPDLPFILPELHMLCRCWIEEISAEYAAANIELFEPSARKFLMNVDEDFRYDKTEEQEVTL